MIRDNTEVLAVCNAITAKHLLSNDTTGHLYDALVITSVVEGEEVIVIPKDEFLYYLKHGCCNFKDE